MNFSDIPPLNTERLTLRRLTESDVPALFGIFSHPEVMRYWSSPPQPDISHAHRLLSDIQDGYRTDTLLQFGIERRADQILIGTCTLHDIYRESRRGEIGYALGRPFWGMGYMREALMAWIEFLFSALDFNRLEADIDPRNRDSAKTLERMGFQQEGLLRERWIVSGEVSDTAIYGLLKRDWTERR